MILSYQLTRLFLTISNDEGDDYIEESEEEDEDEHEPAGPLKSTSMPA